MERVWELEYRGQNRVVLRLTSCNACLYRNVMMQNSMYPSGSSKHTQEP